MTMRNNGDGWQDDGIMGDTPWSGMLKATKDFGELIAQSKPMYHCPVCGDHDAHITSNIKGAEGIWCFRCLVQKLDEYGIPRLERLP